MKKRVEITSRVESAKPAFTLAVLEAGAYGWGGRRARGLRLMGVSGLAVVVGGQGKVRVGRHVKMVERGDLIWLAAGAGVKAVASGKKSLEVMALYYDLRSTGAAEMPGRQGAASQLPAGGLKVMMEAFVALIALRRERETLSTRLLTWAYAARILGLAMAGENPINGGGDAGPEGEVLNHVLGIIESRLAGRLDLPSLAKHAGLSRTHFAQWFRRMVGQSPMRYVRERRIERAKALLLSTDLTVSQVARQVGFGDPAHFNRVFRGVVGEPPLRFVRGLRG